MKKIMTLLRFMVGIIMCVAVPLQGVDLSQAAQPTAKKGNSMNIWLLYWTAPSRAEAERLIKILLEQKMIACANVTSGDSMYTWNGGFVAEPEWYVKCKTTAERVEAVRTSIVQNHPYDTPCVLAWPVDANEKFAGWVAEVVK